MSAWSWLRTRLRDYRAQLRLCLRVTAAALLAFVLAQPLDVPLSGLWAVHGFPMMALGETMESIWRVHAGFRG